MDINNIRSSQQDIKPSDTVLGITYGYIRVSNADEGTSLAII